LPGPIGKVDGADLQGEEGKWKDRKWKYMRNVCEMVTLQLTTLDGSSLRCGDINSRKTFASHWVVANASILECGPMPNVIAALPNVDAALCSTPQSLADAHDSSAVL